MKTFVVALYSAFTSSILMEEIQANSALEAAKLMLQDNTSNSNQFLAAFNTLESLKEHVSNSDHAIEVLQINTGKSWRKYSFPAGTLVAYQ